MVAPKVVFQVTHHTQPQMVFKNLAYRSSQLDAPFVSGAKLKALRFVPLRRDGTRPLSNSFQCMSNVRHRSGQSSNDGGRIVENHCIIVVGASAGGVEALKRLATYLPPGRDLPDIVELAARASAAGGIHPANGRPRK
jgi:chemotaxis response regulator CheB